MFAFTLNYYEAEIATKALRDRTDLRNRFLILNYYVVIMADEEAHDDVLEALWRVGIFPEGTAKIEVSGNGTLQLV